MFDYKGCSEEELLRLCDEKYANKGNAKWLYWPSEVYSFGKYYREQAFYPSFLPLHIYSMHGMEPKVTTYNHELNNNSEAMFVFSKEKQQAFMEKSKKPCYIITPPLIWYRRHHKIKQDKNAKGTIVFPCHSIPTEETIFDLPNFISTIKSLPEDMQPVCVCLHMHDINKGQHKVFLENNIPVYTAGNAFDIKYAQRFYNILKHFKYACSNLIGSYTFYSIEMGIPFSLIGDKPDYFNHGNDQIPLGKVEIKTNPVFKKGINKTITDEQKKYVATHTGMGHISRIKFSNILWKSYINNNNFIKDILHGFTILPKNICKEIKFRFKKNYREQNICPLCNTVGTVRIETVDTSDIIKHYMQDGFNSEYLFKNTKTIKLYQCPNCGLKFFHPTISGDSPYYSHLQKESWYFDRADRYEYEYASKFIKKQDKVLDIGCGKGEFRKYINCDYYQGLDFSEEAIKLALEENANIKNESVQEHAKYNQEKYDVVVLFEIIEHLDNFKEILEAGLKCLKPNGLLIISAPNNDGFIKNAENNFLNMPPHHLLQWNKKSLLYLAHSFNLDIKKVKFERLANIHLEWWRNVQMQNMKRLLEGGKFKPIMTEYTYKKKSIRRMVKLYSLLLKILLKFKINFFLKGQGITLILQKH